MDQEEKRNEEEHLNKCWLENRSENCMHNETKRRSLWDQLKATARSEEEQCKVTKSDILLDSRPTEFFCTGSKYTGMWDTIGMNGRGVYTLPNGASYKGGMKDGMFEGAGILTFADGAKVQGTWRRNELVRRSIVFSDGLKYHESDWNYCRVPDRRFQIEHDHGLQTAGQSYMTNRQPTRTVPHGMFDVEDGFYDPKTKVVHDPRDMSSIIRAPTSKEQRWMIKNCRTAPDCYRGPCLHLYKEWTEPTIFGPPKAEADKCLRKTVTIDHP
ncbi:MORN repeat-containing protein 5 [Eumeta japonica]|uniref:MORN repeat-containing protein 5 n=1 Tax=Eumeta variegata TaxID=151549 RepID=A0A4C1U026_EUMVA|nr:MORN repeat-containing protein 5 [Eumeta japonica]